jgi:hypothetical protein
VWEVHPVGAVTKQVLHECNGNRIQYPQAPALPVTLRSPQSTGGGMEARHLPLPLPDICEKLEIHEQFVLRNKLFCK